MRVCTRRSFCGLALMAAVALTQQQIVATADIQPLSSMLEQRDYLAAAPLFDTPSLASTELDDDENPLAKVDVDHDPDAPKGAHTTKGTGKDTPIFTVPTTTTAPSRKHKTSVKKNRHKTMSPCMTPCMPTHTVAPTFTPTTTSPPPTISTTSDYNTDIVTISATITQAPSQQPTPPMEQTPTADPTLTLDLPGSVTLSPQPTSEPLPDGNSPGAQPPQHTTPITPGESREPVTITDSFSPAPTPPTPTDGASKDSSTVSATPTMISPSRTIVPTPPASVTTAITRDPPSPPATTTIKKTTTIPWLPTSIEPVIPTVTNRPEPRPTNSVPQVVIPNLNPVIPPNSFNVQLRFEHVSYYQVTVNGVLAAQIVEFIPAQLTTVLGVDADRILVLSIRDGSNVATPSSNARNRRTRRRRLDNNDNSIYGSSDGSLHLERRADLITSKDAEDAILVTVAIPVDQYDILASLVKNKASILYKPAPNSFGQFLDPSYPLSKNPPAPSDGDKSNNGNNGNSGNNGNNGNNGNKDNNNNNGGGNKNSNGGNNNDAPDYSRDPLTGGNGSRVPGDGSSGGPSMGPLIGGLVGAATIAYVAAAVLVVRKVRKRRLRKLEEEEERKRQISAPVRFVTESHQGWGWHTRD